VNPTYTTHFDGWTVAESEPLLRFLYAHLARPEFTCRFRWEEARSRFGTTANVSTMRLTTIMANGV
jgi:taurine dioxygenase